MLLKTSPMQSPPGKVQQKGNCYFFVIVLTSDVDSAKSVVTPGSRKQKSEMDEADEPSVYCLGLNNPKLTKVDTGKKSGGSSQSQNKVIFLFVWMHLTFHTDQEKKASKTSSYQLDDDLFSLDDSIDM